MDTIIWIVLMTFVLAFLFELMDSSLGQGYGTLGSPTFILLGFATKAVVPSILLSQACGGAVGSYCQHKRGNVDFSNHKTDDMKKVWVIVLCGVIGVIIASYIGFKISKDYMTMYIGVIVTIMGILLISGIVLKFTWKRLGVIGSISAFNKGMSGGGYGPVVAGGQTIIGVNAKNSVGITNAAEIIICLAGFATWWIASGKFPPLELVVPMCIGAAIAPVLGSWVTLKLHNTKRLKQIMGVVILLLGILCLFKILNP